MNSTLYYSHTNMLWNDGMSKISVAILSLGCFVTTGGSVLHQPRANEAGNNMPKQHGYRHLLGFGAFSDYYNICSSQGTDLSTVCTPTLPYIRMTTIRSKAAKEHVNQVLGMDTIFNLPKG